MISLDRFDSASTGIASKNTQLRIHVRFKFQGKNIDRFKHPAEHEGGPFTTQDLTRCFEEAVKKINEFEKNEVPCDSVFFTVKGILGEEEVFGRAFKGKIRERHEMSPERVKNGEGVDLLREKFLDREKTTPGFFTP